MSKVVAGYSAAVDLKNSQGPVFRQFADDFPELSTVYQGVLDDEGKCVLPPCTLILFWEGDTMIFSLNPKLGTRVAFGGPVDHSKALESVEGCLREGRFEWKSRKGGNRA